MFVIANFLYATAYIINSILTIYMYIIIARAVISWVNPDPYNPIVKFIYHATEPVLYRVRRILPYMGGLDLSPVVVLFVIFFLQKFLVTTLFDLVTRLK